MQQDVDQHLYFSTVHPQYIHDPHFTYTIHIKNPVMKNRSKFLLLVIGMMFYQLQSFAQTINFTGTWLLNFEKSKLEHRPNGLTGSMFIIKQEGETFDLTRYHIFGVKKKKISFKMLSDGKTRRVKLLFRGKLERNDAYLKATLWRKNFLNIVIYKFGSTQNEFVADETLTSKPNNHHNIWVFDREVSNNK